MSEAKKKIAIILEAAGNSTRFGSNKLLHIMPDNRPMICSILDTVRSQTDCVKILVTQYQEAADLANDFIIVFNTRPELGISHTMQLGIKAAGDADAYMFCVCDQPTLTPETLSRLIDEFRLGTKGIVSLSWHGRMQNPKIFSSKYRSDLMAVSGDVGGRQIISDHMEDLLLVEAGSEDEIKDIDYNIQQTSE